MIEPKYYLDRSGEAWWCSSHNRPADWILEKADNSLHHVCDPRLGGIMLPCFTRAMSAEGAEKEEK
jgi:hypothetical protein